MSNLIHTDLERLVELQAQAYSIKLAAKPALNRHLPGARESTKRGQGLEFEELRAYRSGDDVGSIDWRVTQRTGKPHVRVYAQQFEREVLLVVDQSASLFFGSQHRMKSVAAAECAALAAWRGNIDNDRIAAILFNDDQIEQFRAQRSSTGILSILQGLAGLNNQLSVSTQASEQNQLNEAIKLAGKSLGRDNLLVLISDFANWNSESRLLLQNLSRANQVMLWCVFDPLEKRLPAIERGNSKLSWLLSDGEKQIQIDPSNTALRRDYESSIAEFHATLNQQVEDLGQSIQFIETVGNVADQLGLSS